MNIIKDRIKEQDKIITICKNNNIQLLDRKKRSKKGIMLIHLIPVIAILLMGVLFILLSITSMVDLVFFIFIIPTLLVLLYNYMLSTALNELFKLNGEEKKYINGYLDVIVTYEEIENFDIINFEYVKAESDIETMIIGFYFMTFDDKMHFCRCDKKTLSEDIKQILKITHYSNCLRETKIEYECM